MEKPTFIIILGPPGCGKGTQSELLAERFGFYHLETSKIIVEKLSSARKNDFVVINKKKYFFSDEKKKREGGELMSPPLVSFWVKNKIKELLKDGKKIVTSGSPRTLYEAEELLPFLKKKCGIKKIKVVLIDLSEKDSIWRNSHRRTCELLRHPILYNKETMRLKRCPMDGSKLFLRKDDKPYIIKKRLREFKERTLPLVDYFRKNNISIKKIDGSPPPVVVFENILKSLHLSTSL